MSNFLSKAIFFFCFSGFVFDATNNYDVSFHIGGVMLVLSGLLYSLLHLPRFQKNMEKVLIDEEIFPDLPVPEKEPAVEFDCPEENHKSKDSMA